MKLTSKSVIPFVVFGWLVALGANACAQALNEAFLRSTVLITSPVRPNEMSFGTGFFVARPVSGDQGHVLLITNKHVLPHEVAPPPPEGAAQSIKIRVVVGPADKSSVRFVEIPVVGKDGKYLPNVRLHPNAGFDVAAVNVTDAIFREGIQATWIPIDLFSTRERLKSENITVGDEVFLLGYPAAIFDVRNVWPILRTGVIATMPIGGYAFNENLRMRFGLPNQIDGFLIDANVFPGSSGSVVLLKPQATTIGAQGATVVGGAKKIPYVLGIVSGSIPISDPALGSTQRMGLGIVYSADAIREVIDLFHK